MKLADCELEKLLPLFMRQQGDVLAMARTLDGAIRELGKAASMLSDWGSVDEMPEEWLDSLAWELDADWYDEASSVEVKRKVIKNADRTHAHLGTKAAVEQAVSDQYGEANVSEWFEYGGAPGHFKIVVKNASAQVAVPKRLVRLVGLVKRASAILDSVNFIWEDFLSVYAASGMAQTYIEPYLVMGRTPYDLEMPGYAGAGVVQTYSVPILTMA